MAKDKKDTGLIITLIFTLVMPILLIATLFLPSVVESSMQQELENIAHFVGSDETIEIYESVSYLSDSLLVDSGFIQWCREVLLPVEYLKGQDINDRLFFNTGFWKSVDQAIWGLALNLDFVLLRLWGLKIWIAAMIVFTVASMMSGYWIREIKKHGFEYSSPMRHGISRRVLYSLPLVALFYITVPLALPVYFVPIACAVYSMSVMTIVANTIKRV